MFNSEQLGISYDKVFTDKGPGGRPQPPVSVPLPPIEQKEDPTDT